MAHIEYTDIVITLELKDLTINDTIIKRKAELFTLTYNQKVKALSLTWNVKHYSNDNGLYGEYLGDYFPDRTKENIADNDVIVNAQTGEILIPDEEGLYPEELPTMGQYDWFNMVAEAQALNVHDLIRQYGLAADWFNI